MQIEAYIHIILMSVCLEPSRAYTDGTRELSAWYTASSPAAIR